MGQHAQYFTGIIGAQQQAGIQHDVAARQGEGIQLRIIGDINVEVVAVVVGAFH